MRVDAGLFVVASNGRSQELSLHRESYTVGRDAGCQLRLPLASVSRRHAEFRVDGDVLTVRDLGSSNGTFVNRQAVSGDHALSAGDLVAIGPVVLVVRMSGSPERVDVAETLARGLPPTPEEKAEPAREDLLDDSGFDFDEPAAAESSAPASADADGSSMMDFDFDLDDDDLDDQPAL